ncbi:uncharacterized protein LOC132712595 [Pantherophis guttatus]|uniref:Uncharacterized protein LOC132712595 n=1 Tax=Pantherophis guttatus TaxID=94885 RepID=A0ABM3ZQI3_PANGU|nr:uncharacterized protein LOC132712595 [Pantherophis guttatus]
MSAVPSTASAKSTVTSSISETTTPIPESAVSSTSFSQTSMPPSSSPMTTASASSSSGASVTPTTASRRPSTPEETSTSAPESTPHTTISEKSTITTFASMAITGSISESPAYATPLPETTRFESITSETATAPPESTTASGKSSMVTSPHDGNHKYYSREHSNLCSNPSNHLDCIHHITNYHICSSDPRAIQPFSREFHNEE